MYDVFKQFKFLGPLNNYAQLSYIMEHLNHDVYLQDLQYTQIDIMIVSQIFDDDNRISFAESVRVCQAIIKSFNLNQLRLNRIKENLYVDRWLFIS